MSESRHDEWLELILAYEELSPEEQARADAHLASCEGCRTLLARLQAVERQAVLPGELPPLENESAYRLSAAEEQPAQASLADLRARLGLAEQATPRASEPAAATSFVARLRALRGFRPWMLAPVAAAAGVLVLFLLPGPRDEGVQVHDLGLVAVSGVRGEGAPAEQGISPTPVSRTIWRTGEAFRLRFRLAEAGYPVIVHIDPKGRVALLHPEEAAAPLTRFPAGATIELPSPDSDSEWTFEAETGPETFLVAAATIDGFSLPGLMAALESLPQATNARTELVERARELLAERVGPVTDIEVTHTR
jgi:hypothetical protein